MAIAGRRGSSRRNHTERELKTSEEELIEYLLESYDTDARGVSQVDEPVTVTIQLLLLRIQGLVSSSYFTTLFHNFESHKAGHE